MKKHLTLAEAHEALRRSKKAPQPVQKYRPSTCPLCQRPEHVGLCNSDLREPTHAS